MKFAFIAAVLVLIPVTPSLAADFQFSAVTKASLAFHLESSTAPFHYPNTLQVFLRLKNEHDSDIQWVCNAPLGIEGQLFDSTGNEVPTGPSASSIQSAPRAFLLPYGSRLDWLISSGGITLMGNVKDSAALVIGSKGWLIPLKDLSKYRLKVRVNGRPWERTTKLAEMGRPTKLLFETQKTRIALE